MRVPVMLVFSSISVVMSLDCAQHAAGEGEERGDEFEGAPYYDADKAEGQENQPDEWKENECSEGEGPAKEGEKAEEQEVEHRFFSPLKITLAREKSSLGG
jgi:hypothetical protein